MKATGLSGLATCVVLALAIGGCGKKDDGNKEADKGAKGEKAGAEGAGDKGVKGEGTAPKVAGGDQAGDTPAEDSAPAAITPATIDLAKPIPVATFAAAVLAWKGKRVTVGAYPWLASGPDGALEALRAAPMAEGEYGASDDKMASLEWKDGAAPAGAASVGIAAPVVVTCELDRGNTLWNNQLSLTACELVSTDKPFAAGTAADPMKLDAAAPIPVQTLHEAFWGWLDKEVSVVGHYHSHTTSGTGDIRIDLADPATSEKYAGCHVAAPPPESIANDRDGVIVTGKVDKENLDFYNMTTEIQLYDCKLVNR